MKEYIFSFIVGGCLTTSIVYFEVNGFYLLSRIAALFPLFTWLSYLFIGSLTDTMRVAYHTRFVLLGTLCAWVPYMLFIYFFVNRLGTVKTIMIAIVIFLFLASLFSVLYKSPIA